MRTYRQRFRTLPGEELRNARVARGRRLGVVGQIDFADHENDVEMPSPPAAFERPGRIAGTRGSCPQLCTVHDLRNCSIAIRFPAQLRAPAPACTVDGKKAPTALNVPGAPGDNKNADLPIDSTNQVVPPAGGDLARGGRVQRRFTQGPERGSG